MAENISLDLPELNFTEAISSVANSFSPQFEKAINFLFLLSKVLLVILIIYFIIIILLKLRQFKDSSNLSSISRNVQEINSKLDSLIKTKSKIRSQKQTK